MPALETAAESLLDMPMKFLSLPCSHNSCLVLPFPGVPASDLPSVCGKGLDPSAKDLSPDQTKLEFLLCV